MYLNIHILITYECFSYVYSQHTNFFIGILTNSKIGFRYKYVRTNLGNAKIVILKLKYFLYNARTNFILQNPADTVK